MLSRIAVAAKQTKPLARTTMFTMPKAGLMMTTKVQPAFVAFKQTTAKQLPLVSARSLHSSASRRTAGEQPKKHPFDTDASSSQLLVLANEAIVKVQNASTQQLFHWSGYGLAGLAPVALVLSPSLLNFPVDFALGLILPLHMHIGLVGVTEDYVPRPQQGLARVVLAVVSVLTAIGLLKINLCGAGITESVKCVWREPKEQRTIKQ